MALTTAQKISVFEILEVPYEDSVDVPVDSFNLDAITVDASSSDQQLKTKIVSRLTALSSDEETKLLAYVTRWDDLGTTAVVLDGSVGDLSGVAWSADAERRLIQERVKKIVPVMRYLSEIQMQGKSGGNPGSVIPVLR